MSEQAELLAAVRVESPRQPTPHHGPLCHLALGTLPGTLRAGASPTEPQSCCSLLVSASPAQASSSQPPQGLSRNRTAPEAQRPADGNLAAPHRTAPHVGLGP